jgi:hypothetical protein
VNDAKMWRRAAAVMAAACAAFISLSPATALAATRTRDVPAVDIVPVNTTTHDPNQGLWFVYKLGHGAATHGQAQLINPADVPQVVTLYPRQLDFADNGTPSLSPDITAGIGSWVHFDQQTVTVPPQQRLVVGYTVNVPADAEPGDHTGALVAQSAPANVGGRFQLLKRIATRFYVTVPGKVVVAYDLRSLQNKLDNVLWPGDEDVSVSLANTGNIRFTPDVTISGKHAIGSTIVLARSVEVYRTHVSVPWYGGPVHIKVTATANGADRKTLVKTVWVIPWALIAIAVVSLVALVHLVSFIRRRWRRWRQEQAELRRRLAAFEGGQTDGTQADVPAPRRAAEDVANRR